MNVPCNDCISAHGSAWEDRLLMGHKDCLAVLFSTESLALLEELTDDEECVYDHDAYCQVHLYDRPCPHERARVLLAPTRSRQGPSL